MKSFRQHGCNVGKIIAEFIFGLKGDDGACGRTGNHEIVRINAEYTGIFNDIGGSGKNILHAYFNGLSRGGYHFETSGVLSLETKPVVNGENRIALIVENLYPLAVMGPVALASDESAAEHEDHSRLGMPVNLPDTAVGSRIEIQEQVAGISGSELACH